MARVERVLAIDIGATSIKLGEFEYPAPGEVCLAGFTVREYEEELTETSRSVVVAGLLRQMLIEEEFTAKKALISISGQSAFIRFVKLPPVAEEESRIRQIVEFEARQNVPFPMEEVIWDYQLIANPESEDMDVMFIVIKNEIVENMTEAIQAVGLDPLAVDVAPVACYNVARANHVGDDECGMILNIGGRSTNLLFADKTRFFGRTIPIAGHTITQQISKEFGIGLAEAEELKRRHGFVALGGAYAEPESEVAAAVSKIVRNVMARLHGEINRSISVYRSGHQGNRPSTLYLSGGSSALTYTDHFFREKLRMDVEYLNPFQVVTLGPAVDRTRLEEVAHMFGEVVGLGLRHWVSCPVEVTLIPDSIKRQQAFKRKKPYVFALLTGIILLLVVGLFSTQRRAVILADAHAEAEAAIGELDGLSKQITEARVQADQSVGKYESLAELLRERYVWSDVLNELERLRPDDLWIVSITPVYYQVLPIVVAEVTLAGEGEYDDGEMGMFDEDDYDDEGMGMFEGMDGEEEAVGGIVSIAGFEIKGHSVRVRPSYPVVVPQTAEGGKADSEAAATDTDDDKKPSTAPQATPELAFTESIKMSPFFDVDEKFTGIRSYTASEELENLSSFNISVKLAEPLEYYQVGETTMTSEDY